MTISINGTNKPATARVLPILAACSFMVGWDSIMTVPLLPAISRYTGIPVGMGAFLVTAYALAYAVTAPFFGAVSDRWGQKKSVLFGMCILAFGTFLSGLGTTPANMLIFRAITGLGAGSRHRSVSQWHRDVYRNDECNRDFHLVSSPRELLCNRRYVRYAEPVGVTGHTNNSEGYVESSQRTGTGRLGSGVSRQSWHGPDSHNKQKASCPFTWGQDAFARCQISLGQRMLHRCLT